MSNPLPELDPAGIARFRALRPEAIDTVSQRFYTEKGQIYARFGQAGRDACREDIGYHLDFLQPVLEFGTAAPMVDYLIWLASVLEARDIPVGHVSLSLDWLEAFFVSRMETADARAVAAALHAVKTGFQDSVGPAQTAGPKAPEAWPECSQFEMQLLAGNHRGALQILEQALTNGRGLIEAEMHLVQPALYRIGEMWQRNEVTVSQEHLSTSIASMAMSQGLLKSELPPWNGWNVLLACVQGNSHAVGLQMVADAFQLGGWEVQFLGANVPTAALVDHVARWKPHLLGLSVSFPHQLRVVKDVVTRLEASLGSARPRVLVGGLAINRFEALAGMTGADAWGADAISAVRTGARLMGDGEPS